MRFSMKKKLHESAIRARRRHLRESKEQVLNQYQSQVQDLIFDQYKELERYGLKVGLDGKYSDTTSAKFAKDIRKEWIKAATEEKEDEEEFATNPAIDPTKAVDEAIRGLNREMRWNDLKDLYEFAKEVDEREKRKKMKESRFRFRKGRIMEGAEISMAKARELSASSFTDTSEEVIWAIFKIAKDEEDAQRIWEDPSPAEQKRVLKLAFNAADEDTLYWGDQEFNRDESIKESRFRSRRSRIVESEDDYDIVESENNYDEIVDFMIDKLEKMHFEMIDEFFEDTSIKSWDEAMDIIEDYIYSEASDYYYINSSEDLDDAFDDAIKELDGWEGVKKLVKWDEYVKENGVKESRSRRGRIVESEDDISAAEEDALFDEFVRIEWEEKKKNTKNIVQMIKDKGDTSIYGIRLMLAATLAEIIDEDYFDTLHDRDLDAEEMAEKVIDKVWTDEDLRILAKRAGITLKESRFRRGHLRESKERFKEEVFEDMVNDIVDELEYITPSRIFDIAVDDERAHKGKKELLDSILSFMGASVAARYEDEHYVSDVDGIEAANEAADRLGRKSLENDFWEAFQEEKKDIRESRSRKSRNMLKESRELRRMKLLAGMFKRA